MNERELDEVLTIARSEQISFDSAADRYMLYGTGTRQLSKVEQKTAERDAWNARVDARKQVKHDMKRWRK